MKLTEAFRNFGWEDMMKLTEAFRNFAKAPKEQPMSFVTSEIR